MSLKLFVKSLFKKLTKEEVAPKTTHKKSGSDSKKIVEKKNKEPRQKKSSVKKGKRFDELELHATLRKQLKDNGFLNATQVQEKSIPIAISGKNIFCSSETGSGKTLAFLLPMIHKFLNNDINQALIICPTREIAIQIQKTLSLFHNEGITSALVIGGTNVEEQKKALRQYPKVLVATPGRLLDMLNTGLIWLNYTEYVVLDEADRMLDMGFEEDLIKIHEQLSGNHQTLLFSATLFPEIKKMAKRYAQDMTEIVIGNPTSVAKSVDHVVVQVDKNDKLFALKHLIYRNRGKMMVFFNTIKETTRVNNQLYRQRIRKVDCIHSKISQDGREALIVDFREGKLNVLLASDIAARGIDIPNVELVVNYDIPHNSEEYIHRVGRTGRGGKSGMAVSFLTHEDTKKLRDVERLIDGKIKRVKHYKSLLSRPKKH